MADWLPVILAFGALIIATIIVIRYKIPNLTERIVELEESSHEQQVTKVDMIDLTKKKELYDENGKPHYQHKSDCKETQGQCQTRICGKIEEIKMTVTKEVAGIKKELTEMETEGKRARLEIVSLQKDVVRVTTQVVDMLEIKQAEQLKEVVALKKTSIKKIIQQTLLELQS